MGLIVSISVIFQVNPDGAAMLTMWPAWTYQVLLLPPLLIGWGAFGKPMRLAAFALFTTCLAVSNEEPRSLLRALQTEEPGTLRVVSLNCAGGTVEAAEEVVAFKPDVVLLQESPSRDDLLELADQLYGGEGSVVHGPDGSILARGRVERIPVPRGTSNRTVALWHSPEGPVHLVSLRLTPPVFRLDFYNPGSWKALERNRSERRTELQEIAASLSDLEGPLVVGGDFNCAGHDPVLQVLRPTLTDGFRVAGRGWGHSGMNDVPLIRVDQIWASRHFGFVAVRAHKTIHSDHRMVVADLRVSTMAGR